MVVVHVLVRRAGSGDALQQRTFRIEPGTEVHFGRSPDNEIAVVDPEKRVSSRHGCLECAADGTLRAVDAGSLNGTFLNGAAVDPKQGAALADGDVLRFGDFELQIVEARTAAEPEVDLEATICSFDAARRSENTAARLEQLYSAELRGERTTRLDQLRGEIRETLTGLTPPQATEVLRRLAKRFAAPNEAVPDAPPADDGPAAASLEAMRTLAARLMPGARLDRAEDVHHFVALIAQMSEATLGWLARSLKSRSVFAQEFGAEVTMLFQRSNNPLKALSAEGLTKYLLDWREQAPDETRKHYLEAVLEDLAQHQVGVLAGVREAISSVLARLAPQRVEALAKSKRGGFWSSKDALAWATYEQVYAELTDESSKLYHEVISPAIQKGYLSQHDHPAEANE